MTDGLLLCANYRGPVHKTPTHSNNTPIYPSRQDQVRALIKSVLRALDIDPVRATLASVSNGASCFCY